MTYNIQAIVESTTYEMYDGNPFWVVSMVGVGIGPVNRLESRGAQQNGSTDVGWLADNKLLNVEFFINGASRSAKAGHKDTLATILRPRSTPIKWRVRREDDLVKQIDVFLVGMADMPAIREQSFGGGQYVLAQFKANDPRWYEPTLESVPFFIAPGGTEGWQFPIIFPWNQEAGNVIDQTETIDYEGTADTYPEIEITGPADTPLIRNLTTGEKLEFTGNIEAGDSWTVTITEDSADVTNEAGDSVLEYLTEDSDLGTFHLEPGSNDILVQILSGATAATSAAVRYYKRHWHL